MLERSDLDKLTRAELLFLLKRNCQIDARDIANCRWEMANDEATRLRVEADRLEDIEMDAIIQLARKLDSRRLKAVQLDASMTSLKAENTADRARRRAEARWKDLQSFRLERQK